MRSLKIAADAGQSIEVDATPLMNAVDTTNGYVMDRSQIDAVPLSTGSFTGLAMQSAGVNAELSGGTGANSGLGNAPIWANGQRDTSNSFLLNGVDASNLFNGKSTSQVPSARVINSTGVSSSDGAGGVIPTLASIYLSIGNAIPTPAPETLSGGARQRFDVRRAAGFDLWRAHRHEHRFGQQTSITARRTCIAAPAG